MVRVGSFFEFKIWVGLGRIIGVKVDHRETNSLSPYTGVCGFFLSVKFATSTRFAHRGITIIAGKIKSL